MSGTYKMVALKLVILGMLSCALWQSILWVSTKIWRYHKKHDLFLLTGNLLVNISNWIIRKRGSFMFNYCVTLSSIGSFPVAA